MNYLKSITTSVLASTGVSFPFSIGERIPGLDSSSSIWEIREAVKKDDGTPLTLFIFDSTLPPLQPGNKDRRTLMQLARNALKKLRTIRHPDVLKYIDSVETDTHVYIATERVRPLAGVLRDWETGGALGGSASAKGKGKENWIGWGVRSIATALAFLNAPPLSLHHGYIIASSIFVTPAMEMRLGGFDLLTTRDDPAGVLWGLGGLAPGNVGEVSGPEVKKGGWIVLRDADPAQSDIYILGLLIFQLYNPTAPLPSFTTQPSPSMAGSIPRSLFPLWKRMINPNPRTRLSTAAFVAEANAAGFWADNPLTSLVEGLDGFELRSESEKMDLLRTVKDAASAGTIPGPFLLYRVLPSLLHSLSLPSAPSGAMLPLVLELGKLVPPAEYAKMVLDPVIKLYASPDRGTRMALLDGLGEYADKLDKSTVSEKVWPHLITGFADTVPVIREATLKAIFPLSGKLTDRLLNNDLLRLLAKMQTDPEPSIRTNTCILLGRLAPILGYNTKKKVLVPAFARALRDSFVHARVAGLMAFMATVEVFDRDDLASKVIPNMAFAMVDKEKLVRDQAFKAMNMFMKRLEGMVAQMPETMLSPEQLSALSAGPTTTTTTAAAANGSSQGQGSVVNSAAGAATALAGWAIASLGRQLATPEVHSSMTVTSTQPAAETGGSTSLQASSTPTPRLSSESTSSYPGFGATNPTATSKALGVKPPAPKSSLGGGSSSSSGMKLGGKKAGGAAASSSSLIDSLAGEWEDADSVANAWGNDDLIDINADADDWAAFESAPAVEAAAPPPPQSYYVTPASQPNGAGKSTSSPSKSTLVPVKTATATPRAPSPLSQSQQPKSMAPAQPPQAAQPAVADSNGWDDAEEASASPAPASPAKPAAPPAPKLDGMSKEEKDKEMARRREERKARIAAMKEQKKPKA